MSETTKPIHKWHGSVHFDFVLPRHRTWCGLSIRGVLHHDGDRITEDDVVVVEDWEDRCDYRPNITADDKLVTCSTCKRNMEIGKPELS